MYPILQEEMARLARVERDRVARRNGASDRERALAAASAEPSALRRAFGRGFVRAGLVLLGQNEVLAQSFGEKATTC